MTANEKIQFRKRDLALDGCLNICSSWAVGSKRQRFDTLDAVRGVAAVIVLLHHGAPSGYQNLFSSGYLAVDLFFALSGFVIAASYERRLNNGMKIGEFFWLRLVRLYPLVVLGAVVGLIGLHRVFPSRDWAPVLLSTAILLPTWFNPPDQGSQLIAANGVGWSLLWELIANYFYALLAKRLTNTFLVGIVLAGAVGLIYIWTLRGLSTSARTG